MKNHMKTWWSSHWNTIH